MQYTFISVFALVGGFSVSSGEDEYEVTRDATSEALLTRSVDRHCLELDRSTGFAVLMLKGFSKLDNKDFDDALENEVKRIQETRSQTVGQNLALVIKFTGDANLDLTGPKVEKSNFVACFDAIDKSQITDRHAPAVRAITTSFCLESKSTCNIKNVLSGVYFRDEQGRAVYSYTATGYPPSVYVSSRITTDNLRSIAERATQMLGLPELSKICRLYVEMLNQADDQLRAFLLGWTALEVFVNKTFNQYERKLFEDITSQTPSISNYIKRVLDVMKGKYGLADKFGLIAGLLSEQTCEEDVRRFRDIKKIRDTIHEGIQESALPVSDLQVLLSKYLNLHLSVGMGILNKQLTAPSESQAPNA